MRHVELRDDQAALIVSDNGQTAYVPSNGDNAQVTNIVTRALGHVLADVTGCLPFSEAVVRVMRQDNLPEGTIKEMQRIYDMRLAEATARYFQGKESA